RRHADFFLAFAESANMSAEGDYGRRYDLLPPEQDNLRAAIDWSVAAGEIELGLRLAVALENFWVIFDPFEGVRRFETLLAAGGDVPPILRGPGPALLRRLEPRLRQPRAGPPRVRREPGAVPGRRG